MLWQSDSIYSKTYYVLEKEQKEMFQRYEKFIAESANKIIDKVDNAATKCNMAAQRSENATEKLFKVERWRDLMYYAAPAFVLIDVVIRAVPFFIDLFGK